MGGGFGAKRGVTMSVVSCHCRGKCICVKPTSDNQLFDAAGKTPEVDT